MNASEQSTGADANGAKPPKPALSTEERQAKLELLIAGKVAEGYWVESQREADAVLVAEGRRRYLGLLGPRGENDREALSVDLYGHTTIEILPKRRY